MKSSKIIIANEAPSVRDAIWAKPVDGGYALYLLENGTWKPIKTMDDNDTASLIDDAVNESTSSLKKYADTAYINSGTFAKKPSSPKKGQQYFCTDKNSGETGAADGLIIYWNGTNWVNALGVTVS